MKQLSDELHKRDMYLMVDVVVNNIAKNGTGVGTVYSDFDPPFNKQEYFHPFKYVVNYGDQVEAQDGWLGNLNVSLPDLKTELPYIQDVWHTWTKELIANYSRMY